MGLACDVFGHGTFAYSSATSRRKIQVRMGMYDKYVEFAIKETGRHVELQTIPTQEKFKKILAIDGKTVLQTCAFESSKFRLLRSMTIDSGHDIQVLDLAVFPKFEYDLPIFCANFFSAAKRNIIVLDFNPLYNVEENEQYKIKYYQRLMPLADKYLETIRWNEKITSESIKFFSPIVLWTTFNSDEQMQSVLFSAFKDYYMAWLNIMDEAFPNNDKTSIQYNKEAQHRYLLWRATKDPGHALLEKLLGASLSNELMNEFLFNGALTLEKKTFLDYFPEYRCADGTINKKRSMAGKAFSSRPWDRNGRFIGPLGS